MMAGKFRQYNWRDIQRLLFVNAGLTTDEEQRTRGEILLQRDFTEPKCHLDTCLHVRVYDEPYMERMKKHTERNDED